MAEVRVSCFSISVDGFGAGPRQDLENPLGVRGLELHQWFFETASFRKMHGGAGGGTTGVDDELAARGFENVGAWVMGRNMFGPVRGNWPDHSWQGWWGDDPPYHVPVFVLTHHARPPLTMAGGTTFHFVTDGIEAAMKQAKQAAGGKDVRLGGGVSVIRQAVRAGLVDEIHLGIAPILLGEGESLFQGLDLAKLGYRCVRHVPSTRATHVVFRR